MDPNKFYCRSVAQSAASTSSVSSATSTVIDCGSNAQQEYAGCNAAHTSADNQCKESLSRNIANKSLLNHRGTNVTSSFAAISNNAGGYCANSSNGSGNYINVMPVPVGTLQYHRRKLTPQEYQSRLYYNSTDLRCREDYYGSGRSNNSSSSASLHLQSQQQQFSIQGQQQQQQQHINQHQSQQQNQTQQQQRQQHQDQSQQQEQLHHEHQHQHQIQQSQQLQLQQEKQQHQSQHQQHHHHSVNHIQHSVQLHHQTGRSTGPTNDVIDDVISCGSREGGGGRLTAASTQTQHSSVNCGNTSNNYEHLSATPSVNLGSTPASVSAQIAPAHMLYTVHRVVTTAQIQTAAGNTFASSSSVSSVVSAVRSEADCTLGSSAAGITASLNSGCFAGSGVDGTASIANLGDSGNNFLTSNSISGSSVACLRNSPGVSTNINFLPHHAQKGNGGAPDVPQHTASRLSNNNYHNAALSTTNCLTGAKSSTLISRTLQNVIPTCVYLMSRVAVHMEIEGTAQCPAQVMLAAALGCEELGIANKLLAQSIFGLWMTSALLEIQLKSHHRPYVVRVAWQNLLEKFSNGNPIEKKFDEPMIVLRRSVFFSKRDEEKIKDHRILELLYEEAKHNVLSGRYIMEPVHALMLGGIQARIELGPYNSHTHTISFFRENQSRFLPQHVAKSSSWSWLPVSRKNSAEMKLLEQFKRVPQTATTRKLMRKYLEFCWALPFYGAAFFQGQVEQPVRGLMSLVNHKDVEVLIAINERGVFVIDPIECTLLLGLRYEDLSWDFAKPSSNDDPECLTCVFIQFDAVENGIQVSKLMQIFSKQAAMIDALISHFAEQMRKRKLEGNATEQFHDEPNPIQNNGNGVLCNKLSRLTLATFDEEGRCIGQMGSLSISY